ncbi:MAG TPA: type IV toxin-antitoxin system AbiEi family antitoxin domain-containing protein [Nocardioidaceae bacterium]|nr:type IV toxin-antitoxin system AbiEi family antitoxin domain-containing protein [Nocardioidaceae bacterium]
MRNEGELRRLVATYGVFLRREALAIGYDTKDFRPALRDGTWVRVRHGAYTFAESWPADEIGQHNVRTKAVMRTHEGRAAPSHQSSVLLRDIDSWGLDLSQVHLTRTNGAPVRPAKDIRYHEGACSPDDLEVVDGLHVTSLPRALLETAYVSTVESGVVLFDSALRSQQVTIAKLEESFGSMRRWPGSQHTDLVMRLADGKSGSVGESRARHLMWSQGIPMPVLQYPVFNRAGIQVAATDFAWPKYGVLGEFDGRYKYSRFLQPGERPEDVVFREKQREDLIRELTGWRVFRMIWADLYEPRATAARLRAFLRAAA